MTAAEWLTCSAPGPMLEYLGSRASERKLRLFAAACCVRLCRFLPEERWQRGIETIQRIADGFLTPQEATRHQWGLGKVLRPQSRMDYLAESAIITAAVDPPDLPEIPEGLRWFAGRVAVLAMNGVCWSEEESLPWFSRFFRFQRRQFHDRLEAAEKKHQAFLVRDIFGNPFLPVALDSAWLTPTVTNLAAAAYEEPVPPAGDLDPTRLAVLADALEEAGCTDPTLLGHLRQQGAHHVKGCFVIDLLLGR